MTAPAVVPQPGDPHARPTPPLRIDQGETEMTDNSHANGDVWVVPKIRHDENRAVGPRIHGGWIHRSAGQSDPEHTRHYAAQLLAAADEVERRMADEAAGSKSDTPRLYCTCAMGFVKAGREQECCMAPDRQEFVTVTPIEIAHPQGFGGHEFEYETTNDVFRCVRCRGYEIALRNRDTGEISPCPAALSGVHLTADEIDALRLAAAKYRAIDTKVPALNSALDKLAAAEASRD